MSRSAPYISPGGWSLLSLSFGDSVLRELSPLRLPEGGFFLFPTHKYFKRNYFHALNLHINETITLTLTYLLFIQTFILPFTLDKDRVPFWGSEHCARHCIYTVMDGIGSPCSLGAHSCNIMHVNCSTKEEHLPQIRGDVVVSGKASCKMGHGHGDIIDV